MSWENEGIDVCDWVLGFWEVICLISVPSLLRVSSSLISCSTSSSEIIHEATNTYSVTKLGMRHFIIAAFPRRTFSSTKCTVYAWDTTKILK